MGNQTEKYRANNHQCNELSAGKALIILHFFPAVPDIGFLTVSRQGHFTRGSKEGEQPKDTALAPVTGSTPVGRLSWEQLFPSQ